MVSADLSCSESFTSFKCTAKMSRNRKGCKHKNAEHHLSYSFKGTIVVFGSKSG